MRRTLLLAAVILFAATTFAQKVWVPPDDPKEPTARLAAEEKVLADWANLARYRDANAKLGPVKAVEKRVVFMGDSITDMWDIGKYFPGKPYVNRGISGQTTPQMLVRFRPEVVELKPAVVVILAGTNDIAGNTGPMSLEDTQRNYASMAELAQANGIAVVFSSVLPVHNYTERSKMMFSSRPPEKIVALNNWLKQYCAKKKYVYLDYFSHMVDEQGMLRAELADDGLHPKEKGYQIMAPLAEEAIGRALGGR